MKIVFKEDEFRIFDNEWNEVFVGEIEQVKTRVIIVGDDPWCIYPDNKNPTTKGGIDAFTDDMNDFIRLCGFDNIADFFNELRRILPGEGKIVGPITWPYVYIKEREDTIKALKMLVEGDKGEGLFD